MESEDVLKLEFRKHIEELRAFSAMLGIGFIEPTRGDYKAWKRKRQEAKASAPDGPFR